MSHQPLPPGSTIGILGGGQLGRMLAIAAAQIGYRCHIYAPEDAPVAGSVADRVTRAAWDDEAALDAFAAAVDVVTLEFENVPLAAVERLAARVPVRPGATSLRIAQDRVEEKRFAESEGVRVSEYAVIERADDIAPALTRLGGAGILKSAREGYDGKGQVRLTSSDDAAGAWAAIGERRAVLEAVVPFVGEFSVLIARCLDENTALWECPQNRHDGGILVRSNVPADPAVARHCAAAIEQSMGLAHALDHVGVLAVEWFACEDGAVFNEMAPRVHNSGHWTIEGAVTSQFENHIRAVVGLPVGAADRIGTAVEMRNLIGDQVDRWRELFADRQAHLHLYGKGHGRAGRKMGHVTWVRGAARGA